jgi:cytoskeletal protein RodZ
MKRCPQCKFIYPDSDEVCDLDGTPLIAVTDAEVDAVAGGQSGKAQAPKHNRRTLAITAIAGLALGAILFIVYYGAIRSHHQAAGIPERSQNESSATPLLAPQQTLSTEPSPLSSPSPEASSAAAEKSTPSSSPGSQRNTVSSNPVSTGMNEGGKTVIRLTNGARIEADEVWRTKEGFWYRRDGIVTLIKANRVKAIEKAPK